MPSMLGFDNLFAIYFPILVLHLLVGEWQRRLTLHRWTTALAKPMLGL